MASTSGNGAGSGSGSMSEEEQMRNEIARLTGMFFFISLVSRLSLTTKFCI